MQQLTNEGLVYVDPSQPAARYAIDTIFPPHERYNDPSLLPPSQTQHSLRDLFDIPTSFSAAYSRQKSPPLASSHDHETSPAPIIPLDEFFASSTDLTMPPPIYNMWQSFASLFLPQSLVLPPQLSPAMILCYSLLCQQLQLFDLILISTPGFLYSSMRSLADQSYDHVGIVLTHNCALHISPPFSRIIPIASLLHPSRKPLILRPKQPKHLLSQLSASTTTHTLHTNSNINAIVTGRQLIELFHQYVIPEYNSIPLSHDSSNLHSLSQQHQQQQFFPHQINNNDSVPLSSSSHLPQLSTSHRQQLELFASLLQLLGRPYDTLKVYTIWSRLTLNRPPSKSSMTQQLSPSIETTQPSSIICTDAIMNTLAVSPLFSLSTTLSKWHQMYNSSVLRVLPTSIRAAIISKEDIAPHCVAANSLCPIILDSEINTSVCISLPQPTTISSTSTPSVAASSSQKTTHPTIQDILSLSSQPSSSSTTSSSSSSAAFSSSSSSSPTSSPAPSSPISVTSSSSSSLPAASPAQPFDSIGLLQKVSPVDIQHHSPISRFESLSIHRMATWSLSDLLQLSRRHIFDSAQHDRQVAQPTSSYSNLFARLQESLDHPTDSSSNENISQQRQQQQQQQQQQQSSRQQPPQQSSSLTKTPISCIESAFDIFIPSDPLPLNIIEPFCQKIAELCVQFVSLSVSFTPPYDSTSSISSSQFNGFELLTLVNPSEVVPSANQPTILSPNDQKQAENNLADGLYFFLLSSLPGAVPLFILQALKHGLHLLQQGHKYDLKGVILFHQNNLVHPGLVQLRHRVLQLYSTDIVGVYFGQLYQNLISDFPPLKSQSTNNAGKTNTISTTNTQPHSLSQPVTATTSTSNQSLSSSPSLRTVQKSPQSLQKIQHAFSTLFQFARQPKPSSPKVLPADSSSSFDNNIAIHAITQQVTTFPRWMSQLSHSLRHAIIFLTNVIISPQDGHIAYHEYIEKQRQRKEQRRNVLRHPSNDTPGHFQQRNTAQTSGTQHSSLRAFGDVISGIFPSFHWLQTVPMPFLLYIWSLLRPLIRFYLIVAIISRVVPFVLFRILSLTATTAASAVGGVVSHILPPMLSSVAPDVPRGLSRLNPRLQAKYAFASLRSRFFAFIYAVVFASLMRKLWTDNSHYISHISKSNKPSVPKNSEQQENQQQQQQQPDPSTQPPPVVPFLASNITPEQERVIALSPSMLRSISTLPSSPSPHPSINKITSSNTQQLSENPFQFIRLVQQGYQRFIGGDGGGDDKTSHNAHKALSGKEIASPHSQVGRFFEQASIAQSWLNSLFGLG